MYYLENCIRGRKRFILILFCLICMPAINAQIHIKVEKEPISKVLKRLEKQIDYKFFYNSKMLVLNKQISLNASYETIEKALSDVFKNEPVTWDVKEDSKLIVLINKKHGVIDSSTKKVKIIGRVLDMQGEPLIGATVILKAHKESGTITNLNGFFELMASVGDLICFSYVGMETKEMSAKEQMTVKLIEFHNQLDDIVVVGYTSKNRKDISAAIASVNMKAIQDIPSSSIMGLLSGQIAGMQSVIRSGTPGQSGSGLVIRGNTNLSNTNDVSGLSNPLYIVDGVPMSLQDFAGFDVSQNDFFATLNPNEIKSIDVLKDAAATAIYGSRGANGVVVISTKRGTKGSPRFTVGINQTLNLQPSKIKLYVGEAEREKKLELLYKTMNNLYRNYAEWIDQRPDKFYETMSYAIPSVLSDKYNPAFNNAYDFQKMFYQNGYTQSYDLSMDGGNEHTAYRIAGNYYKEQGVLVGYGFSRFNLNSSLVSKINKSIENDISIRFTTMDRDGGLNSYMRAMPTDPMNLPSSLFSKTSEELNRMSGQLGEAYNSNVSYSLNISDGIRLKITDQLSWNNQGGVFLNFGSNDYFIPSTAREDEKNYGYSSNSINTTLNYNSVLNYYNELNEAHAFGAMVGFEVNTDKSQLTKITATDGASDYLKVLQGFSKENIDGMSDKVISNLLSYFGTATYKFKNRYQVEGVIRRDASSRFGANNKWATFPSGKLSWIVSREPWMKNIERYVNFAKLRISYGTSGQIANDPLLQYNSINALSGIGGPLSYINSGTMDVKTYGGFTALVADFNKVANKGLTWSTSKEINYGFDLELFNKRLYLTGDVYSKYSEGLVFSSYLPSEMGYTSIRSNLVDMISNGFELSATVYTFPRDNAFQWEWILNLAKNKSVIAKLGNGGKDYISNDYAFRIGEPAFQYYMSNYLGVLQREEDLPVNPKTGQPYSYHAGDAGLAVQQGGKIFPGMPLFTDVNGDYMIDGGNYGNDFMIIPNKSPEPKIQGGLHANLKYKGISLRIQSSFAFGHWIYNSSLEKQLSRFDKSTDFIKYALYDFGNIDFWEKPGDDAYYPMILINYVDGGTSHSFRKSSMYLEKGDYWSIDNITLSYTIPDKFLRKFSLKGVNINAVARNVYMWKASNVSDPRMITKNGYYNGEGYPLSPSFNLGFQFQF